ncbi:MAG: hypothetical protein AAF585_15805, partial [Verrucomicrobiota bacterium]
MKNLEVMAFLGAFMIPAWCILTYVLSKETLDKMRDKGIAQMKRRQFYQLFPDSDPLVAKQLVQQLRKLSKRPP